MHIYIDQRRIAAKEKHRAWMPVARKHVVFKESKIK